MKADFNDERLQRSPTFTTSSGEGSSHDSAITGLKPLPEVSSTLEGGYGDTFQIGRKIMHPSRNYSSQFNDRNYIKHFFNNHVYSRHPCSSRGCKTSRRQRLTPKNVPFLSQARHFYFIKTGRNQCLQNFFQTLNFFIW